MGPFVVFLGTDKSGSIQLCPSVKMILLGFFFFIYFSSFSFSIWYLSFTLKTYLYVCLFVYTVSSDLSISKGSTTITLFFCFLISSFGFVFFIFLIFNFGFIFICLFSFIYSVQFFITTLFFAGAVHAKTMKQNDAIRKRQQSAVSLAKPPFFFFCKKRRRPSLFHGLALMLIIPFLLFFLVLFPAEQYFLLQAVSLLSCTYIRICILLQRIRP